MQYLNIMEDFNKVSESVEAIQADSNTIKDEGNVPLVKMVIKKKIEPINNKFPEQFEEKNIYNNLKI